MSRPSEAMNYSVVRCYAGSPTAVTAG